jgi:hypothetical protein
MCANNAFIKKQLGSCGGPLLKQLVYPDGERLKVCPRAMLTNIGIQWIRQYRMWDKMNFAIDMSQLSEAEISLIFNYENYLNEFSLEVRKRDVNK